MADATPGTRARRILQWLHTDRGSSTVETAIWMPVLFAVILLAAQLAFWLVAQHAATAAATTAVDQARLRGATTADGTASGRRRLDTTGVLRQPSLKVRRSANTVTVTVTGSAPRILPIRLHVSATQTGPVERDTRPSGTISPAGTP
ncbi:TadE/TadG family type IV pilus assembly protein [Actinocatenispora comari]|uniref:Membrane protein n=1 Tax=Actinocatenispora comari TaxID=2807577 RepID=A0A8J4EMD0_9ACTN|nr:TadE family protein [Actinocatenispora comari]GIL29080.1 membrane protein [Actinocatenispora comari]